MSLVRVLEEATPADTELLISQMRELWLVDHVPFNEAKSRRGLALLFTDRTLGRAYLAAGGAGYLILSFGFSLEFGGRDAFIDEFYLGPDHRGKGLGSQVLEEVSNAALELGIQAIHLEVDDKNTRAELFYRRHGFAMHQRRLMTRWLV